MVFFFQAEDGIRDLVRSRGLGDVYKRQLRMRVALIQAVGLKLGRHNAEPTNAFYHAVTLAADGVEALSLIHI